MMLLGRAVLCVLAVIYIGIDHVQGASRDSCNTPGNERGICLNIRDCPLLLEMLRTESHNLDIKYLRRSICGYEGKNPLVCCPETPIESTLPGTDVCGRYELLPTRIRGGSDVQLATRTVYPVTVLLHTASPFHGSFPWIAALGYYTHQWLLRVSWLCAGSLVTGRHIITAAHCVTDNNNRVLSIVRLGDLDLDDSVQEGATPTDYEVDTWIPHPEYKTSDKVNDIAIVRLKDKVNFTSFIQPICLPALAEFRTINLTGQVMYIAGWGATAYRGTLTTRLQQAKVQVSDHQMCREAYGKVMRNVMIDNTVVCAGDNGKDSCQGDSGGPLMLPDRENVSLYLYGIVSYGYKCAEPGYPGVYTRVPEFMAWILPNLK